MRLKPEREKHGVGGVGCDAQTEELLKPRAFIGWVECELVRVPAVGDELVDDLDGNDEMLMIKDFASNPRFPGGVDALARCVDQDVGYAAKDGSGQHGSRPWSERPSQQEPNDQLDRPCHREGHRVGQHRTD